MGPGPGCVSIVMPFRVWASCRIKSNVSVRTAFSQRGDCHAEHQPAPVHPAALGLESVRIRHGGGWVSPEQLGLLPEEDFPPWSVAHLVQVIAGDFLGGPVERGDPARGIGCKE